MKHPDCENVKEVSQEFNLPVDLIKRRLRLLKERRVPSTMRSCALCKKLGAPYAATLEVCCICLGTRFRSLIPRPLAQMNKCHVCGEYHYLYAVDVHACPACVKEIARVNNGSLLRTR